MIPLIKIRATFLKRKKVQVFFNYILIPLMLIIGVSFYKVEVEPGKEVRKIGKQIFEYKNGSDFYLFKNINFAKISRYISNTSFIVNDKDIGNKLVEYISEELNVKVNLYSNENELNNHSQNIIIYNYNKEKNNFKFSYNEKEIVNIKEKGIFSF